MKKRTLLWVAFVAVGVLLGLIGCGTVSDLVGQEIASSVSSGVPAKTVAVADFKDGEVLCATDEGDPLLDNTYYAAKILTPASAATKNQAEALLVSDGKKLWTEFVIPSHKAAKEELQLGKLVLYHVWASSENISPEDYRLHGWYIGRITNTDELFKNLVEVGGDRKYIKWIRIPDQPLE